METLFLVLLIVVLVVAFTIMVAIIQTNFKLTKIHEALMAMMTNEQLDILLKDLDRNANR